MSNLLQMGTDFEKKLERASRSHREHAEQRVQELEKSVDKALSLNSRNQRRYQLDTHLVKATRRRRAPP
ncbi:MbeB family mobilization protein [Escherichia coli]